MTPNSELQRTIGEMKGEFRASMKAIRVNLKRLEDNMDEGFSTLHSRCTDIDKRLVSHTHNSKNGGRLDLTIKGIKISPRWAAAVIVLVIMGLIAALGMSPPWR